MCCQSAQTAHTCFMARVKKDSDQMIRRLSRACCQSFHTHIRGFEVGRHALNEHIEYHCQEVVREESVGN